MADSKKQNYPKLAGVLNICAALLLVSVVLTACNKSDQEPPEDVVDFKGLPISGFNYTDLPISSFEVNSIAGGNLRVSSETSGGGAMCCVRRPTYAPLTYIVAWTRGPETPKSRWCRMEVIHKGPLPKNPKYFVVHFYQDGHIEVDVTEERSEARVKLPNILNGLRRYEDISKNKVNDEALAECKNGPF